MFYPEHISCFILPNITQHMLCVLLEQPLYTHAENANLINEPTAAIQLIIQISETVGWLCSWKVNFVCRFNVSLHFFLGDAATAAASWNVNLVRQVRWMDCLGIGGISSRSFVTPPRIFQSWEKKLYFENQKALAAEIMKSEFNRHSLC